MSARKRRIKRKIALLARMDDTRSRMSPSTFGAVFNGTDKAMKHWETCMKPLARWLKKRGHGDRAHSALNERCAWRVYTGGNP